VTTICREPARIGVYPYESPLNGVDSDSDAVERAIADIQCGDRGSARLLFNGALTLTRPLPALDRVFFEGDDCLGSSVRKAFPGGILFNFGGRAGYSGGGLLNFAIPQCAGTPGSYTIVGRARADGYAPDRFRLENLYVGSGAGPGPFRHLELTGAARLSPLGIREPIIRDITLFGATSNVFLSTLVGADVQNLAVFPAGGAGADVHIQNCVESSFTGLNVDGQIHRSGNIGCGFFDKSGAAL
jgi:hypothetical protein